MNTKDTLLNAMNSAIGHYKDTGDDYRQKFLKSVATLIQVDPDKYPTIKQKPYVKLFITEAGFDCPSDEIKCEATDTKPEMPDWVKKLVGEYKQL